MTPMYSKRARISDACVSIAFTVECRVVAKRVASCVVVFPPLLLPCLVPGYMYNTLRTECFVGNLKLNFLLLPNAGARGSKECAVQRDSDSDITCLSTFLFEAV